jgi:hypothetical protein
LILDSPFLSLKKITRYQIKQKTGLPNFLISPIITLIADKIEEKGSFLFDWINPEEHI